MPGFKYVITEIMSKMVFMADNLKLTALLTLDFDQYLEVSQNALELFFDDKFARTHTAFLQPGKRPGALPNKLDLKNVSENDSSEIR